MQKYEPAKRILMQGLPGKHTRLQVRPQEPDNIHDAGSDLALSYKGFSSRHPPSS